MGGFSASYSGAGERGRQRPVSQSVSQSLSSGGSVSKDVFSLSVGFLRVFFKNLKTSWVSSVLELDLGVQRADLGAQRGDLGALGVDLGALGVDLGALAF